jgi:hypothetical protein
MPKSVYSTSAHDGVHARNRTENKELKNIPERGERPTGLRGME